MSSFNAPVNIIIDAGNTDIKAMVHTQFGKEIVFPHFVDMPTDAVYGTAIKEYSNGIRNYIAKKTVMWSTTNSGNFVVGQRAAKIGKGRNVRGAEKYTRDQIGALVKAAMYILLPGGCDNVHLTILHPADINADNLHDLIKSVGGRHKMTLPDRKKVEYNVTQVIPDIEPVAGFQTFMLNTSGEKYTRQSQMDIMPGMRFLVCDLGGALTSFVPVYVDENGAVDIDTYGVPVIRNGIADVYETLKAELKASMPDILGRVQNIDEHLLAEAVSSDTITLRNKPLKCANQVENAMQTIAYEIKTMYQDRYNSGIGFNGIVLTGGGGGVAYEHLKERVFGHDYVFTAEESIPRMRFSNIRGSSKGMINFLMLNRPY